MLFIIYFNDDDNNNMLIRYQNNYIIRNGRLCKHLIGERTCNNNKCLIFVEPISFCFAWDNVGNKVTVYRIGKCGRTNDTIWYYTELHTSVVREHVLYNSFLYVYVDALYSRHGRRLRRLRFTAHRKRISRMFPRRRKNRYRGAPRRLQTDTRLCGVSVRRAGWKSKSFRTQETERERSFRSDTLYRRTRRLRDYR